MCKKEIIVKLRIFFVMRTNGHVFQRPPSPEGMAGLSIACNYYARASRVTLSLVSGVWPGTLRGLSSLCLLL